MFYKLEDDVVHKPANTTTTTIVRPAEREVAVRVKVEDDDSDGSSNESEGVGDREGRCLICGYLCSNSNYGCKACNACAAFFRRTIKQSRSYVCPRGKNCRVDFGGHKRTCRYCRFQRCVAVGMSVHYVLTKHHSHQSVPAIIDPTPTDIEDVLFRRLTESFGGTFVHRFHAKSRAYEWCGISLRRSNSSLLNTTHSMFAEFEVMLRYLRASGICKYLNGREELAKLCARLFYPWVFINGCWSTLRNGGHRINTIFFADESSVRVSRDAAEEYLRPIPQLRNSDYVASSLATLHHKAINAGVKFYTLNMDSTDFAFICQIITLHFAIQLFPWKTELQDQLNQVFRTVSKHHQHNFRDYTVRLGNLMLMIDEATTFIKEFEEWVAILTLNGCHSVLQQIINTWDLESIQKETSN